MSDPFRGQKPSKSEKFGDYRDNQPDDAHGRVKPGKDPSEKHFAGIMRKAVGEKTDVARPPRGPYRLVDRDVTPKGDKN